MTASAHVGVGVEVPASSANLGPGFDSLAAALDVTLSVVCVPRQQRRVVADGVGADELPAGDDSLLWRGVTAYCGRFGAQVPDVSLHSVNAIPLERGMGSSAAAAVAGVALGRAMVDAGGTDGDLVALAADLEGHADNAAAAVLGGLVVCADALARRVEPSSRLRPVVCVPTTRQSTSSARSVLPRDVPLRDAAANGGRTAMVLAGLSGSIAWEPSVMHDVLHEPARFAVMSASGMLVTRLRDHGVGACLSGAGPTVLAIVGVDERHALDVVRGCADDGWDVRPVDWHRRGASRFNVADRPTVGTFPW